MNVSGDADIHQHDVLLRHSDESRNLVDVSGDTDIHQHDEKLLGGADFHQHDGGGMSITVRV